MEEHLQEDDTEEEWAWHECSIAAPGSGIEQSKNLSGLQPPQHQMALKLRSFLQLLYVHMFYYARNYPLITYEVGEVFL